MLTIRKSAITLGILGAMIATTATPTLAKTRHHVKAPATEYGQQVPYQYGQYGARGAFAAQPYGRGFEAPQAQSHPGASWDDYAKRWDGGN